LGTPTLHVRAVGTGALERVEVRNGLKTIAVHCPYADDDLGDRVKVIWSGGEVRGRARLVAWHGGLTVEGGVLRADQGALTAINFWNADRPLRQLSETELAWRSVTTGGLSGLILALAEPGAGVLHVRTEQGAVDCPVGELGLEPRTWSYGGLRKELSINRLPVHPRRESSFALPLAGLRPGDNPIYVKLIQEDGHMAWSSPIYVVREE
jgi:hypothetical protein